MSAIRKALRQALRTRLLGRTAAGTRVYTNRAEGLNHVRSNRELPAVVIYSLEEAGERMSQDATGWHKRSPVIGCELFTVPEGLEPWDDTLDDLAEEVYQLVMSDPGAGGVIDDWHLTEYIGTEVGYDSQGNQLLGAARLSFRYHHAHVVDKAVPDPQVSDLDQIESTLQNRDGQTLTEMEKSY